tara:strand:- start:146 stop:346 length:201 start_codon:yes stop_codon:yes gene_type:complete
MSTSKNDITGDLIQSKVSDQKKYTDNFETVFSKKEKWKDMPVEPRKDTGPLVPTGLAKHWERSKKK